MTLIILMVLRVLWHCRRRTQSRTWAEKRASGPFMATIHQTSFDMIHGAERALASHRAQSNYRPRGVDLSPHSQRGRPFMGSHNSPASTRPYCNEGRVPAKTRPRFPPARHKNGAGPAFYGAQCLFTRFHALRARRQWRNEAGLSTALEGSARLG